MEVTNYNSIVSVIMPSYNKEKYIAASIESVLNQTFKDFELIIIDDASIDSSVDIIKRYHDSRIRFYQNDENMGIARSRNKAIELAKGKYIALLDADDLCTELRLEKEVSFLDNHSDIDVVFGSFQEIDENNVVKETYFTPLKNPQFIKARLMVQDVIPNGSCMYRKDFIDHNNIRYRDGYLGMDDYLFWVECSLHGRITGLPDIFLYWRNTDTNSTNTYMYSLQYQKERENKFAEILKFALRENGFELTETELSLYCRILSEYKYRIVNKQEIQDFYLLIQKLCKQAEKLTNYAEIKKMYKKQFGLSLENSFIWDDIDQEVNVKNG
ncbi:MAG: glycosyltransferase [Lachnospiraceae bacterium]|nr:glycosyltransferase [Lachnospiraceae bacterium]